MLLALDPSLKGSGYCFGPKDYGVLHFSGTIGEDLNSIYNFLDDVLSKNPIKYIIREGYAFGFSNFGITRIIEVGGITHLLAHKHGLKILDVAPTTIKKIITGSGKATKQDVMKCINTYFNETIIDDNISDAIALYIIGEAYIKIVEDFGKVKVCDKYDEIRKEIEEKYVLRR
jgi:Holliday junction resolvasome RuvABC endonuclease subunit